MDTRELDLVVKANEAHLAEHEWTLAVERETKAWFGFGEYVMALVDREDLDELDCDDIPERMPADIVKARGWLVHCASNAVRAHMLKPIFKRECRAGRWASAVAIARYAGECLMRAMDGTLDRECHDALEREHDQWCTMLDVAEEARKGVAQAMLGERKAA